MDVILLRYERTPCGFLTSTRSFTMAVITERPRKSMAVFLSDDYQDADVQKL
jgi:hypothetical protein